MGPVDEFKAVKVRVTECLHLASAHFGKAFPEIPVKFDLTGRVGGYYCYHKCDATGKVTQSFRFNRALVRENLSGEPAEFGKNRTTRASPLSASAIAIVFCIAALLRVPDRRKKVKDCGTTNGHIELMARTLMKDAREDLVR